MLKVNSRFFLKRVLQRVCSVFIFFSCFSFVLSYEDKLLEEAQNNTKNSKDFSKYYRQFQEAFEHISQEYLNEPNYQSLIDNAIKGMVFSLDPFSGYYTKSEIVERNVDSNFFSGIGILSVKQKNEEGSFFLSVVDVFEDSPASKAGIVRGDRIIAIDGYDINFASEDEIESFVSELKGESGTKVSISILKAQSRERKEVELKREYIKIFNVQYDFDIFKEGGVAYIKIGHFLPGTINDLKRSVKESESKIKFYNKKLFGIVLDLRDNTGGILEEALNVSEYFISSGLITKIIGRNKKYDEEYFSSENAEKGPNVPLVVLINSKTVSSAELVASALQDHKRAILLGENTFGKGLVQHSRQLNNDSIIKITTSQYYRPNGTSVNAEGVSPDIFVTQREILPEVNISNVPKTPLTKSYLSKYNTKGRNIEIQKSQKKNISDDYTRFSKRYNYDFQYIRAVDLIYSLGIKNLSQSKGNK